MCGEATGADSLPSIYAMNGKSVEVDNTDAEGRLVLSGMKPAGIRLFVLLISPKTLFTTSPLITNRTHSSMWPR